MLWISIDHIVCMFTVHMHIIMHWLHATHFRNSVMKINMPWKCLKSTMIFNLNKRCLLLSSWYDSTSGLISNIFTLNVCIKFDVLILDLEIIQFLFDFFVLNVCCRCYSHYWILLFYLISYDIYREELCISWHQMSYRLDK